MMRRRRPERGIEDATAARFEARAGETIVVACSGGPDSVALAALAARVAAARDLRLVLAHVDHGVRPESGQDAAVVLAAGVALRARVAIVRLAPGGRDEARLRDLRYVALAGVARAAGARRVLTAHHAADQTESVLLALFRGTGVEGLGGMPPSRGLAPGIALERPLLEFAPAALREYVLHRHLPYALDRMNADAGYRRVALRQSLATLRASFPGLDESVARYAALAREERAPTERGNARRELRSQIAALTGDLRDLSFARLDASAGALTEGRRGRYFLRRGVELRVNAPDVERKNV